MTTAVAVVRLAVAVDQTVPGIRALFGTRPAAVGIRLAVVGKPVKTIRHANLIAAAHLLALATLAINSHLARLPGATQVRTHHPAIDVTFASVGHAVYTARRLANALFAYLAIAIGGRAAWRSRSTADVARRTAINTNLAAVFDVVVAARRRTESAAAHTAGTITRPPATATITA